MLGAEQARISEAIDATESTVGRVASFAGVAVTLLIPGTAILIYFLLARRQMRELRNATEAKIDAARHLAAAKDELIAGLSHELRTPLTSIYGFSELLLGTGMVDPTQARELLAVINSESAELSRMVEDLLTASRLDAGAISFELTEVALHTEMGAVLEPFQRGGLGVVVDCVPATVRADRLRLRQVLRNLISNAQKHGGPNILVESRIRGDKVFIAVIDDGAGVPSAIEARLFQRFVHDGRHALLAGSVGLGLSIAKTLIEAMGGSMVYQRVDGWTAFTFTLPVSRAEQEAGSLDLTDKERQLTRGYLRRLEPVRGGGS